MNIPIRIAAALSIALTAARADPASPVSAAPGRALSLWYRQPASRWEEALPAGNGRLGAMVFGGIINEQVQLNENTIWSGGGPQPIPSGAYKALPQIRQLLFDGNYTEAEKLVQSRLLIGKGEGNSYQTLGDLLLNSEIHGQVSGYRRSLDLDSGIIETRFSADGVQYRREVFSSHPDQVIVIHWSADQPGKLAFTAAFKRQDAQVSSEGQDTLVLSRTAGGTKFAAILKLMTRGGELRAVDGGLTVSNSDDAMMILAVATDYNRANPLSPLSADLRAEALRQITAASVQDYPQLKNRSISDHQRLFRRVDLRLGASSAEDQPTDARLAAVQLGSTDLGLDALYFQYGRYLLISCSRPGSLPSNLQGIWNKDLWAPWGSDYHININIQMDYWPAEVCNLSECHEPFFDFVEAYASVSGRRTAQEYYGARGFVGHYTTDAWLYTPTAGQPKWALWQMGGAWCTRHFIEHYWYTGDRSFLQNRAYPILRDASLFFLDWLVANPKTGKWVSGPSASPENEFIGPDGLKHSVSMGDSMDQEIVWDTFNNFLAAARELGIDGEEVVQVRQALDRLAWPGIGADGRLMEWAEPFQEPEPGHRHISHLFGLYPGRQFTLEATPQYVSAARKTIEYRLAHGGGHTGWSRAWIISFWARLHDAEQAYTNFEALLQKSTLPNLFDSHPPFQIDGNFGGNAAIAEMLLQSHQTRPEAAGMIPILELLPALPRAWPDGSVEGLRARGGFEVGMAWRAGRLRHATVRSLLGRACRLQSGKNSVELTTTPGRVYEFDGDLKPQPSGADAKPAR